MQAADRRDSKQIGRGVRRKTIVRRDSKDHKEVVLVVRGTKIEMWIDECDQCPIKNCKNCKKGWCG